MTYDTVVIGAGVAGLTAALRLAEAGQRVAVVAKGVGATHLAPATIDVLGYAPQGVQSPAWALPRFVDAHPNHPYARLAPWVLEASIRWFGERVGTYDYIGGLGENYLLPTAVGVPKPSALVPETMAAGDLRRGGRFAFVGFGALKDFYPSYLADNLNHAQLQRSVSARAITIDPPVGGEADVGALAFARRFEDPEFREAVVRQLEAEVEPGEAIGFPAVLGIDGARNVWLELQQALGRPVFEVPTLPPSVPGIRVFRALTAAIRRYGGRVVIGAPVVEVEAGDRRVAGVATGGEGRPARYCARSFVLATGGLASGGMAMDSYGKLRETVFGLPLEGLPRRGEAQFLPGYFDRHPASRVGVAVDQRFRPIDPAGSAVYENLHVAGATLAGAEPWREKSGDGISLSTGYAAAEAVLGSEE